MNFIKSFGAKVGASLVLFTSLGQMTLAQTETVSVQADNPKTLAVFPSGSADEPAPLVTSVLPNYYSQTDGISLTEIVWRAIENYGDLKIARLEIDKAKARLTQARLRSNPTVEIEQTSGRFVGSPGDGELTIGFSLPIDVYGQRGRRIDLAQAEITVREMVEQIVEAILAHAHTGKLGDGIISIIPLEKTVLI